MCHFASQRNKINNLALAFIASFIYALFAMSIARELLIPHFFATTEGHIPGDPYYYHLLALEKLNNIRTGGISEFEIHPGGQGIAGIMSLAYILWENPYCAVLINAFLHAVSVVVTILILQQWFPLRIAFVAAIPLGISPYMMLWFSQLNKESFALVGTLSFTYGLLRLVNTDKTPTNRDAPLSFLLALAGILCLWLVRPYVNQIFLPLVVSLFVPILILKARRPYGLSRESIGPFYYSAAIAVCLVVFSQGAASDKTIEGFYQVDQASHNSKIGAEDKTVSASCLEKIDIKSWQNSELLPNYINGKLKALMGQRCLIFTLLETHKNPTTLKSIIDTDQLPNGSLEALHYLPRAVLLGVFAPWPQDWAFIFSEGPSLFYTVTPLEALLLYIGLLSLSLWFFRTKQWTILIPVGMSVGVMSIYAMATPFLGALYRYRYPWWMILICLGTAAFLTLIKGNSRKVVE